MIVIDASATIALLLNEDAVLEPNTQIAALAEETVIAPSHWAAEVGNALVINVRRRRLEATQLDLMIDRLETLGIKPEPPPSFAELAAIARQAIKLGLTYYDAAYVHKAQSRHATLFTFDRRMREVGMRLNIPVMPG